MKDTLQESRAYFTEQLKKLADAEVCSESVRREMDLIYTECLAEFGYRSGFIRGKIVGMGLESNMEDIVTGMNKCRVNIALSPDLRPNPSEFVPFEFSKALQTRIRANSDILMIFALEYIDRWVMYNNLFGENKQE